MIINLSHLNRFKNKWVALDPETKAVLASADTLQNVASKLKQEQRNNASFLRVLDPNLIYSPFVA